MVKGTLDKFQSPLKGVLVSPGARREAGRRRLNRADRLCDLAEGVRRSEARSSTPLVETRRPHPARRATRKRTRIQAANEARILDAALEVFSTYGYRGATVDQIAARAGMTKPNLLYYFRRKPDIYLAVLNRTHEMWLQPLEALDRRRRPGDRDHRLHRPQARDEPRQPEGLAPVRHGDHPGRADPRRRCSPGG